jgi:hypothetical protein
MVRDFSSTKEVTENFIEWANNKLEVEESEVKVNDGFYKLEKEKEPGNFPMNQSMIH